MRKLVVFDAVTLDGYFTDLHGDMSWAHRDDPEWRAFTAENARGGGALLFGRVTYEMMASFWPTPLAASQAPAVAERMNALPKVVFSRTLGATTWSNTTLLRGDLPESVRTLKQQAGGDITVLGSGSIVAQLCDADLIDELQLVVTPVVLGSGRTLFEGARPRRAFQPIGTRSFANGNVLLRYAPIA